MGNLLSRSPHQRTNSSNDHQPDLSADQSSQNSNSPNSQTNSILSSLLSSMELAQQTLLLRHLNRRRRVLASSTSPPPDFPSFSSSRRRRAFNETTTTTDSEAQLPPPQRSTRMRLRPRSRADQSSISFDSNSAIHQTNSHFPSGTSTNSHFPSDSSTNSSPSPILSPSNSSNPRFLPTAAHFLPQTSPITVIVNILNQQAETPSLPTIMNAVVQALSLRNPSHRSRSWRHVPFLIVIRTATSYPIGELDLLMDAEGNIIIDDPPNNPSPDYSIFVTENTNSNAATSTQSSPSREENVASMIWNALALASSGGSFEELVELQELLGYGHPQLRAEDLGPIQDLESLGLPSSECPICLEMIKAEEGARLLECKHVFHAICVDRWLCEHRSSCPLCRTSIGGGGEKQSS